MWTIQLRVSSTPFPGNPFTFLCQSKPPGKVRPVRERQDHQRASRPPVSHTDLKTRSASLVKEGDTDLCWSESGITSSKDLKCFCQAEEKIHQEADLCVCRPDVISEMDLSVDDRFLICLLWFWLVYFLYIK